MRIPVALFFFVVIVLIAWRGVGIANKIPGTGDRDTLPRSGPAIFNSNCNPCHKDSSTSLAPSYSILASMTPRAILEALDKGKMREVASGFSEEERRSVAEWITHAKIKVTLLPATAYTSFSICDKP